MGGERVISVFGSSRTMEGTEKYEEARSLGRLLAESGFTVYSGGYSGIMEAVSRGAKEGGGRTVGVTVRLFDPLPGNPWLDEEIKMDDLFSRLERLILSADGFLVLGGGLGTLVELSLTWILSDMRVLRGKPILLLGDDWQAFLEALSGGPFITQEEMALLRLVGTPQEAVGELRKAMRMETGSHSF